MLGSTCMGKIAETRYTGHDMHRAWRMKKNGGKCSIELSEEQPLGENQRVQMKANATETTATGKRVPTDLAVSACAD